MAGAFPILSYLLPYPNAKYDTFFSHIYNKNKRISNLHLHNIISN